MGDSSKQLDKLFEEAQKNGVIAQKPCVINLGSDEDTPVQTIADLQHMADVFGGTENLKGKKIAAYYGCLLLRPNSVMRMDDPENPTIMEDFIRSLGADAVVYAMRNECCGGYIALESPEQAAKQSRKILDNAVGQGAECLVTACPLCRYNLEKNGGSELPVVYLTALLAEALGLTDAAHGVKEEENG